LNIQDGRRKFILVGRIFYFDSLIVVAPKATMVTTAPIEVLKEILLEKEEFIR
jgi:hypothetical protein